MSRSKNSSVLPSTSGKVEIAHHRAERFYLKFFLGGLIGLIVLIALCWGGHDVFVRWQERRLVRQAVVALEKGDDRKASLAARNVLDLKPTSAGAARIMAQLGERSGDRVALDWRRKVAQAQPESTEDALAWARCALQFNDPATAERALDKVSEAGRQSAGYHAVAALLAQARQQEQKAEAEWNEAVRLDPNDKNYQLQLGTLRSHSPDRATRASGEAMLEGLRTDPKQQAAATRALIKEGVDHRESAQHLIQLARELQSYPDATLNDQLLLLDFLHQTQDDQYGPYLTEVEKRASANLSDLSALLSWMSQNNLNLVAVDLLKSLPKATLSQWPVSLAVAEIYARLQDWRQLEETTRTTNWRDFDFARHAYLARALRAEDKPAAAEREWGEAVKQASSQSASITSLVRVTSEWKWDTETIDLLWALTKHPEKQNEALQTLYRLYGKKNDTQGLYRVLVRLHEAEPDNSNIANNLAQLELLLNATPDQARRSAAELYRNAPSNPAYAATYAYSLLTKGDVKGAVKIMSSLSQEQLRDPAISAYYGICLAATHSEAARPYLEAGQKALLLPEEKALVAKALASLAPPRGSD